MVSLLNGSYVYIGIKGIIHKVMYTRGCFFKWTMEVFYFFFQTYSYYYKTVAGYVRIINCVVNKRELMNSSLLRFVRDLFR